jgi:transcriptional regulator with XRE-family HTH domain
LFDWLGDIFSGIGNAIGSTFEALGEQISNVIWNTMLQWLYETIYNAVADFFTMMGNMGADIFQLDWIQATIRLFTLFGWALFAAGVVVAIFDVAIEYQCGRANIKTTAINILKGFFACSLIGIVPVELYKFCVSLQNTFSHDLSAIFAGGRSIGVTNKTISRWENGNYMPDVEMLSLLSKEFGVSINELISGERLWAEDFKKAADDNLVTALNNSTFTLKEKIVFFKKKWLHEHISTIVLCVVAWIGIIIWTALKLRGSDSYALLGAIGSMLAILFYVVLYNRMMVYVENHAYRATPDKETETKN